MKSTLRFLLLLVLFVSPIALFAQTLIAGWDFQTTTNGGTAVAAAPNAPNKYLANVGTQANLGALTATMFLDNTNGSSQWVTATANNEVTSFTSTALNTTGTSLTTTTTGAANLA